MATSKNYQARREALILQAAAEVRSANPHLDATEASLSDAEYAELEHDRHEREQIWNAVNHQPGGPIGDEPAAQAVDSDRGE